MVVFDTTKMDFVKIEVNTRCDDENNYFSTKYIFNEFHSDNSIQKYFQMITHPEVIVEAIVEKVMKVDKVGYIVKECRLPKI